MSDLEKMTPVELVNYFNITALRKYKDELLCRLNELTRCKEQLNFAMGTVEIQTRELEALKEDVSCYEAMKEDVAVRIAYLVNENERLRRVVEVVEEAKRYLGSLPTETIPGVHLSAWEVYLKLNKALAALREGKDADGKVS